MSYTFYSSLHLISLFYLALVLAALWGLYTHPNYNPKIRSVLLSLHGLIMFLILLAGFGLMAKIKIHSPWPLWIYIKLLLWLSLSAFPFLIKKTGQKLSSKDSPSSLYHFLSLTLLFILFTIAILSVKLRI